MKVVVLCFALLFLSACGVSVYPGQPGMVTNSYAKIDIENLDAEGLWVYEVVYDNSDGGKGVGAIVTKLFPGAQTYTSNVRTNEDGTLYRTKAAYNGAEVQMIAVPSLNQIHLSPNSKVQFLVEYATSLDEVDDKSIAEADIFKPVSFLSVLTEKAFKHRLFLQSLIQAAKVTRSGLAYEVMAADFKDTKFTPTTPILVEANLAHTGLRTNLTTSGKQELVTFMEKNFPKGYKGPVQLHLKNSPLPLEVTFGIHSMKTAEAAGYKIIKNADQKLADDIADNFARGKK